MSEWTGKSKEFFDGFERGMSIISRHGWSKARDMFNEQYPIAWRPNTAGMWQHAKGFLHALTITM